MAANLPVDSINMSVERQPTSIDPSLQPESRKFSSTSHNIPEIPHDGIGNGRNTEELLSPYGKMETVFLDVPDVGGQDFSVLQKDENTVNYGGNVEATADVSMGTENTDFIGLDLFANDTSISSDKTKDLPMEDNGLCQTDVSVTNEALFTETKMAKTAEKEEENALRKYFSLPPDISAYSDPSAQSFFDTLSLGISPMMKSVSDITAFPDSTDSVSDNKETTDGVISECIGKEVLLSAGECKNSEIEISEEAAEYHSVGPESRKPENGSSKTKSPETPDVCESNDQPIVSQLFVDNKGGGDVLGKAFFDSLAGLGPPSTEPILNLPHEITNLNTQVSSINQPLSKSSHPSLGTLPQVTENPFLGCTELDRHYEPWIPCEKTHHILVAMVTSPAGCYFPEKDQLTMPGVIIEDDMMDPVKMLLEEISPEEAVKRNVCTVESVPQNVQGLKQLISSGCYHAAINLTTRLLTAVGQGPSKGGHPSQHTPYSLQLWFTRLALFVKLRKFSYAEVESEAFGDLDKPDLYYEFYPDAFQGKKGSMVSFSFRLLLAELPQYQGNHQAALDKLFFLLSVIQKILTNLSSDRAEDGSMIELSKESRKASISLWEKRECLVLYSILNSVLSQKDYVMAVSIAEMLLEKDKDHIPQIYAALGRIYLQLGDVKTSQLQFNKVTELNAANKGEPAAEVEELINKALMAIALNDNAEAYKYYQQAHTLQSSNSMLVNNMAVCLLYMGKLKDALTLLEDSIQKNPSTSLHDGILFNTCTLYELESSRSAARKQNMLNLVAKHTGDNFLTSCLKIQLPNKS